MGLTRPLGASVGARERKEAAETAEGDVAGLRTGTAESAAGPVLGGRFLFVGDSKFGNAHLIGRFVFEIAAGILIK